MFSFESWIIFLVCLSIIADNVSGDVETFVYASEYSEYNCFLFEIFFSKVLPDGWMCVYDYALHDCVNVQMHVLRGSIRMLFL